MVELIVIVNEIEEWELEKWIERKRCRKEGRSMSITSAQSYEMRIARTGDKIADPPEPYWQTAARGACFSSRRFQPFGGGHGTPQAASCARVHPPGWRLRLLDLCLGHHGASQKISCIGSPLCEQACRHAASCMHAIGG